MSWREVVKLLDGGLYSGKVATEALTEIVEEDNLQDLFHLLITSSLCHEKEITRFNAAVALQKFSRQYRLVLLNLLEYGL
jgi:aspartate/glutamate racemase